MSSPKKRRFRVAVLVPLMLALGVLLLFAWLCAPRATVGLHEGPIPVPLFEDAGRGSDGVPGKTLPETDQERQVDARAASPESGSAGAVRSADFECPQALEEMASELLESYAEQPSCALVEACYLDLFGNTWASAIRGDSWVELCFVSRVDADLEEERCHVRVVHLPIGE